MIAMIKENRNSNMFEGSENKWAEDEIYGNYREEKNSV